MKIVAFLLVLVVVVFGEKCDDDLEFPEGFLLGTATASYQIEGGWNASGKGENIWDHLTHSHPDLIKDHSTGDVACNSYHLWQKDLTMLEWLGVDHYRFSLSWNRILPSGFPDQINPDGVKYYRNLLTALRARKIEPMVTLYHWDLPQSIQNFGGWTNTSTADHFENFARIAFEQFGDLVKYWITINEPSSICVDTYEYDNAAPAFQKTPGVGLYQCGKSILLAHAQVYRLYDREFRSKQQGFVGITIDSIWAEPATPGESEASEREMQMQLGWWANPIFSAHGDYPQIMKERIASNSQKEGLAKSRLPEFTQEEVELIQGTFDFFGLNHYNTYLVSNSELPDKAPPSYRKDRGNLLAKDPNWKPSPKIVPWGLRKLLNWVKNHYNNTLVIITENGYGDSGGLSDQDRVTFLTEYMKAVLQATLEDGCNVKGYTVWSLLDNMEWRQGYTVKFGLFQVDFNDPNRARRPRLSADLYREILKTRNIPGKLARK